MLPNSKITEIFCSADDFCKEYSAEINSHKNLATLRVKTRYRKHEISDSEIITILMLYHFGTFKNVKSFYLFYIGQHLSTEFPKQLSYSCFISIEHKVFVPMTLFLNIVCFGECTGISFVDSTKISVYHNKRIFNHKTFNGFAKREKITMGWFYGFKLHFIGNEKGEILSFYFSSENTDHRDVRIFEVLKKKLSGKLYADKGYVSQNLFEMLFSQGIHIVTGLKANMRKPPDAIVR